MRRCPALAGIIMLVTNAFAHAQDTLLHRQAKDISLDINLAAGWYKQNPTADDISGGQHVYIPDGLPRRAHNTSIQNVWNLNNDRMTDNPLRHGCLYIDLALRGKIGSNLTLYSDLVGEHRGFSGGLYNTANIMVYPKMKAVFQHDISLGHQRFTFGAIGGYRDTMREMEGLMIYNVDLDNATIYTQWRRWRLSVSQIGDMLFTGLGIDDLGTATLSLEGLPVTGKWKTDIRLAAIVAPSYGLSVHEDISAAIYQPGKLRLYMQFSHRDMEAELAGRKLAGLMGMRYNWKGSRLSVRGFMEARYYDAAYNRYYIYEDVYYRPQRGLKIATDYVGAYLYPLMNFERPYSKWAVYAEYQDHDVAALNAYADIRCRVYDHFFAKTQLDLNYISPSGLKASWLPFYDVGVGYEVVPGTEFTITVTNKAMNLDKHYQDFYLLQEPCVQFRFIRAFSWD